MIHQCHVGRADADRLLVRSLDIVLGRLGRARTADIGIGAAERARLRERHGRIAPAAGTQRDRAEVEILVRSIAGQYDGSEDVEVYFPPEKMLAIAADEI